MHPGPPQAPPSRENNADRVRARYVVVCPARWPYASIIHAIVWALVFMSGAMMSRLAPTM